MRALVEWKNDPERKPLVLRGARQVGKTWLLKEFARCHYQNSIYVSFDEEEEIKSLFESNKDPHRIIELLGLLRGEKIVAGKTLIVFDEVQECPSALGSLKYFAETANEFHVVSAGSLLGVLLAAPQSYPVGKVNLISLYPLDFGEFLAVFDRNLFVYFMGIRPGSVIDEPFHTRLLEAYDYYLIIGGMPEAVHSWFKYKDPVRIARIQNELITLYEHDFAKHNGRVNSGRILLVFRKLVSQLAKDNEKFIYGCLKQGARAREFEEAIEWLCSSGIVSRLYNVSRAQHPLAAFDILDHFKLFMLDTGLLKHQAGVDNSAILLNVDFQFKGPLTENYVLQQIAGQNKLNPRYLSTKNGDIDFLIQNGTDIVPLEVKSGKNKRAAEFKRYIRDEKPRQAIRFSKMNYMVNGAITNIPLYMACRLAEYLQTGVR